MLDSEGPLMSSATEQNIPSAHGVRAQWWRSPRTYHFASIVAGAVFLIVVARHQWFFFDEWAFLIPGGGDQLFAPHVGHWSTTPILITHLLRAIFGLSTYWPYIAPVLAIHLVIAHLLWRISLRAGANPWLATALAAVFIVLGAGSENILWAFQIGFMGALLLGLIVITLLDTPTLSRRRMILVLALSLWSLTFSGTAIPMLIAAGIVSLRRHRLRKTAILFAPPAFVYVVWYLLFERGHDPGYGPHGLAQLGILVPEYVGHLLVDGIQKVVPFVGFGAIIVFAVLIGASLSLKSAAGSALPAYALLAAGLIQALLTGLSRVSLGTDAASSGRYVYALVAAILPICGVLLSRVTVRHWSAIVTMCIALVLVTGYNATILARDSVTQANIKGATEQRLYAGLDLALRNPGSVDDSALPAPTYAPDVTLADLLEMHQDGWINVGHFDLSAELSAMVQLEVRITPAQESQKATCTTVEPGTTSGAFDSAAPVYLFSDSGGSANIFLMSGTTSGDRRAVDLSQGWVELSSHTGEELEVTAGSGELLYCNG